MYEVGVGESPMGIAERFTGNPYRYGELLEANPHKDVIYVNGMPTFASLQGGEQLNIPGGFVGGGFFDFIVDVVTAPITLPVKAAGKVATAAVQTVATAAGLNVKIDPIEIPVVSDISNIVASAASQPFKLADAIASGERIDKALVDNFKRDLKIIKDVAPYVQTVVSFVPGIGTGVAAAIAAGAALAEGKSIDEVAKAALRGAVPGGAIGQAAFDTALKVASGESVDKAVMEAARNQLPEGAKQAFDIGVAVATGENLQNSIAKGLTDLAPAQLKSIVDTGAQTISKIAPLATAIKGIAKGDPQEGFKLAAGLLSQKGISEKAVSAVRGKLSPAKLQGFDAALRVQAPKIGWLKNVVESPPVIFIAPLKPRPPSPEDLDKKMLAALMVLGAKPADMAARQQLVGTSWQWAAAWQGKMSPASTALANALNAWAKKPDDKAVYQALINAAQDWGVTKGIPKPKKPLVQLKEAPHRKPPTVHETHPAAKKPGVKAPATPVQRVPAGAPARKGTPTAPLLVATAPVAQGQYGPYPTAAGTVSGPPSEYGPYAVSAPPHGGHHGGHHHGGHPGGHHGHGGFRRGISVARDGRSFPGWWGPWWGVPYNPETVPQTQVCQTWGNPIEMPPAMQRAASAALGASKGQPTTVRGPDNVLYLFSFENGMPTARPCAAVANVA